MSVINKALSEMTEKKGNAAQPLEKVDVTPIENNNKAIVLLAGGLLLATSAGLFFWLNSGKEELPSAAQVADPVVVTQSNQQESSQPATLVPVSDQVVTTTVSLSTPQDLPQQEIERVKTEVVTADGTELSDETFEQEVTAANAISLIDSKTISQPAKTNSAVVTEKITIDKTSSPKETTKKTIDKKTVATKTTTQKAAPTRTVKASTSAPVAKNTMSQPVKQTALEAGVMEVVQVELTPQQLADKASARARKALDANDYSRAIKAYESALKYTPRDENIRKRVAALYYGRSDTRRAVRVLQQGIELDNDSQNLRLALVNILIKQDLPQAALGVIEHLPDNPEVDYLAARAGLAQQIKRQELALESYQLLTEKDGNNAKWWLGLAISQERSEQLDNAKVSYNKALNRVGLSNKTHDFIRSRLVVIKETKQVQHAD